MKNEIGRKLNNSGSSESGSKKPRDFTSGRYENKPVTSSDLEKDADEMIGKARTALKEMHADKQVGDFEFKFIDGLLKSCGSSCLSTLEGKSVFIIEKIREKVQKNSISRYTDKQNRYADKQIQRQ